MSLPDTPAEYQQAMGIALGVAKAIAEEGSREHWAIVVGERKGYCQSQLWRPEALVEMLNVLEGTPADAKMLADLRRCKQQFFVALYKLDTQDVLWQAFDILLPDIEHVFGRMGL
jgi:hypothetical protein